MTKEEQDCAIVLVFDTKLIADTFEHWMSVYGRDLFEKYETLINGE